MNVKTVRFYASHAAFNTDESISLVRDALALLQAFNMTAIVCLQDGLDGARHIVPGDDLDYKGGHLHKDYFLQKKYRVHYLPHIQQIVSAFKDNPTVILWELGNEHAILPRPALDGDSEAYIDFVKEATGTIKAISRDIQVSTGLINSNQVSPDNGDRLAFTHRLYQLVDAVTIHFYNDDGEEQRADIDLRIAKALGKPFYVGEVGATRKAGSDRVPFYTDAIRRWKEDNGAFLIMPWAFDVSPTDVGISDNRSLAKSIYKEQNQPPAPDDFVALTNIVKQFA